MGGRVTVPNKKSTDLATENESLRARVGELERMLSRALQDTDLPEPSEGSLRESEVRYRRLFETAKDGILILDADSGRITDANPFLEVMLGYSRTELIGRALWEIGPFKDGDRVLRELGRVFREKLRKSDISCRFGGEEFVLVLPGSTLADAQHRVEQIRLLVKDLQVRHNDQILGRLTVSGGVAASPEHGSTAPELLRAADAALYCAKQAGRDRVVPYQKEAAH
jgi:PAS domain S-box-containing protein